MKLCAPFITQPYRGMSGNPAHALNTPASPVNSKPTKASRTASIKVVVHDPSAHNQA